MLIALDMHLWIPSACSCGVDYRAIYVDLGDGMLYIIHCT